MSIRRLAIPALAGIALALVNDGMGMAGDMASGDNSMLVVESISTVTDTVVVPMTSDAMDISTDTAMTTLVVPSATLISMVDDTISSSIPTEHSSSDTITSTDPSVTTSSTDNTDMSDMPTSSGTDTMDMNMDHSTMGSHSPNASAPATDAPVTGDGIVNGVSVGLFLVSLALTVVLQM